MLYLLVRYMLPHQYVIADLRATPTEHETEETRTRVRPKSSFRYDGLDKIRCYFRMITRQRFYEMIFITFTF